MTGRSDEPQGPLARWLRDRRAARGRRRLAAALRPVARAELGGRPSGGITSRFGGGFHARPGEGAAVCDADRTLWPTLQVRTDELPGRYPHVGDHALLQLWLDLDRVPVVGDTEGDGWCVRTYDTLDNLVSLSDPTHEYGLTTFPVRWAGDEEPPAWESADEVISHATMLAIAQTGFPDDGAGYGTKVGGWPTWVQGATRGLTDPDLFVLQVSDEPKAMFGFDGDLYLFRKDGSWRMDTQFT